MSGFQGESGPSGSSQGGGGFPSTEDESKRRKAEENRRINQRALISRLPFEILSEIFRFVKDSYDLPEITEADEQVLFGVRLHEGGPGVWMRITHVCHAWRRVALSTPSLWTRIVILKPNEWGVEMARRSKQLPLTVIVDIHKRRWKDIQDLTAFSCHIDRCRTLSLRGAAHRVVSYFLLFQFLPLLEHLDIQCEPYDASADRYPFVFSFDWFFSHSLRRLSLEHCHVNWNCCMFGHLTHLKLAEIPETELIPCDQFVHLLVQIPALEVLHLNDCFSDEYEGDGDPVPRPRVRQKEIGHLKFMYLSFEVRQMVLFLNSISVAPLCRIFLSTWVYEEIPREVLYHIFHWILDHYNEDHDCDDQDGFTFFRTLRLRVHAEALTLRGYNKVVMFDEALKPSHCIFDFTYICEDEELFEEPVLRNLFSSFRLCHLRAAVLCIEGLDDPEEDVVLSKAFFRDIFCKRSPLLQELLLKLRVDELPKALLPDAESDGTNDHHQSRPFPALTSLILHDSDYQEVFDALRTRSGLGFRIERVLISTDTPGHLSTRGFNYFRPPIEELGDLLTSRNTKRHLFRCESDSDDSPGYITDEEQEEDLRRELEDDYPDGSDDSDSDDDDDDDDDEVECNMGEPVCRFS